ncbi:MAG: MBL fold metallo-hydrolase [Clostridiales bacterium]|nr:MBL fold metallo-hydrolase [Clostridiales bacterium]
MSQVQYFKAKEIAEGSYLIQYAFTDKENTCCYLVIGQDRAIVIDTMNGYGHLRAFCETLTDKPLYLVNTHFHFDHCAGNFDFDACWMHHRDIADYYDSRISTPEQMAERVKKEAFPELVDQIEASDMTAFTHHIPVYPLYDGDLLDLGDRTIEVVWVGGHTAGSVAFIDKKTRIAYTGDCCNCNTLLGFGNSLPVETYLKNLLHFHKFKDQFDIMYGGHEVQPPTLIEEGIELAARILAGTDDKAEEPGFFGTQTYGARHSTFPLREDGKTFNMTYNPERRFEKAPGLRVINFQKKTRF